MPLLALVSILGYAFLLFYGLRKHAELILFSCVSGIICLVYFLGLLGFLKEGAFFIFYLGVLLFLVFACLYYREKELFTRFFTPGVSLFLLLSAGYWLFSLDARYFYWDEFSNWGLVTKELLSIHRLYDNTGIVLFPHYPPAAGVWQYFICLNTGFSEGTTFFAQFILLISPLLVLFKNVTYRQWLWILDIFLFSLFLVANLGHGITSLYVDHILSVYFGGIIVAFLTEKLSPEELLLLFPPLFCLPLIKEVGYFLGFSAALFILLYSFLSRGSQEKQGARFSRQTVLPALMIVFVCAAPFFSRLSWDVRLNSLQIDRFKLQTAPMGDFFKNLAGESNHRNSIVKQRFFELFFHQPSSRTEVNRNYNEFSYSIKDKYNRRFGLSACGWFVFSTCLFGLALSITRDKSVRNSIIGTFCFISIVFIIYTGMLLYLYLFILEGERMASFDRYFNIIVLPMVFLAGSTLLPAMQTGSDQPKKAKRKTPQRPPAFTRSRNAVFIGLLVFLYLFETPCFPLLTTLNPRHQIRDALAAPIRKIQSTIASDQRLYVIFMVKESGFARIMLHYDLAPLQSEISPSGVRRLSEKELAEIIANYDYVWCLAVDTDFYTRNGGLFHSRPSEPLPLYKVHHGQGAVSLELVPW